MSANDVEYGVRLILNEGNITLVYYPRFFRGDLLDRVAQDLTVIQADISNDAYLVRPGDCIRCVKPPAEPGLDDHII
jgi:hypothetical protein